MHPNGPVGVALANLNAGDEVDITHEGRVIAVATVAQRSETPAAPELDEAAGLIDLLASALERIADSASLDEARDAAREALATLHGR